jgi:hypothetical protein
MHHSLPLITAVLALIAAVNSDYPAAANHKPNILHIDEDFAGVEEP